MKYDPNTPVSQLGLSPLEARAERQRRSRAAERQRLEALRAAGPRPTLEDRLQALEDRLQALEDRE